MADPKLYANILRDHARSILDQEAVEVTGQAEALKLENINNIQVYLIGG